MGVRNWILGLYKEKGKIIMTEHEKLLAGLEYDYMDSEIQGYLQKARTLKEEYNSLPNESDRRKQILDELLGEHGEDVTIQSPFRILYGVHVKMGNHVFINAGCNFLDGGMITIGD